MKYTFAEVRKAVVAFAGFIGIVAAALLTVQGVIPEDWVPYVNAAIAVSTAIGVFYAENEPTYEGEHAKEA